MRRNILGRQGQHGDPGGARHPRSVPGLSLCVANRRPAKNTQPMTAAPGWTPPRCRCSPAARPRAPAGGWSPGGGAHREREDEKEKPLRKIAWALEATIATMARPPGAPPAHPNLAAGLAMTRPGEDPGGTGARVLASM